MVQPLQLQLQLCVSSLSGELRIFTVVAKRFELRMCNKRFFFIIVLPRSIVQSNYFQAKLKSVHHVYLLSLPILVYVHTSRKTNVRKERYTDSQIDKWKMDRLADRRINININMIYEKEQRKADL